MNRADSIALLAFAVMLPGLWSGCAGAAGGARTTFHTFPWTQDGLIGRRMVTEHFEIVSTLTDREFESALPEVLEAAYERFGQTLPPPATGEIPPLKTYLFGTRAEWLRYTARHYPARYALYSRIRAGGYSEGETSVSFYTTRSDTLATLIHEAWHQYAAARRDALPAWLNEGLACYYEAVSVTHGRPVFTPRRNTFRLNALREAVQSNAALPIAQLLATDAGRVVGDDHSLQTQRYYAQVWALVVFLRHEAGARSTAAFADMLDDIAAGRAGARITAQRLGRAGAASAQAGEALYRTYFGEPLELEAGYFDFLVRVSGLR